MVEHSPKIFATEEKATISLSVHPLILQSVNSLTYSLSIP